MVEVINSVFNFFVKKNFCAVWRSLRGFSVDVGNLTVVESGKDGKPVKKQLEVDFICNKGSRKYYIQSAYMLDTEEKMAQKIRPFQKSMILLGK